MDDSEKPFKVDGNKVWLSQTAREYAREWFEKDEDGRVLSVPERERMMAIHLMRQENLRAAGLSERDVPSGESEDF